MSGIHRTRVSNVRVVGSGAAGLRAAIAVHTAGRDVVIVGKRLRKDAQGSLTRMNKRFIFTGEYSSQAPLAQSESISSRCYASWRTGFIDGLG